MKSILRLDKVVFDKIEFNRLGFKNDTEFKDYIFKLMNDQKLYKDMSTNARNSTYKYSKEVFAADILKVYHKAMENKH